MRNSSNPILRNLDKNKDRYEYIEGFKTATYKSIIIKGSILSLLLIVSAVITTIFLNQYVMENGFNNIFIIISVVLSIVGFISVLVSNFKVNLAKYLSFVYILCQGYIIGLLNTVVYNVTESPVIGLTAGFSTLVVFLVMLFLHSIKAIRVTNNFRKVLFTLLISFILISIITTIIYFVTGQTFSQALGLTPQAQLGVAIGINVFVIILASLFLLLDFNNAQTIVNYGLTKDYEWLFLIGLFVTLVWLYTSIVRLLFILFARNN